MIVSSSKSSNKSNCSSSSSNNCSSSRSSNSNCSSGSGSSSGIRGGGLSLAALALIVAFLTLSTAAAAAAAAATGHQPLAPEIDSAVVDRLVKRNLGLMDCGERCESFEIKIFKAYWQKNYPNMHFIDFLRDMVVYSAHFPEFKQFKPIIDQAVQSYELCRYVTCSTDYMG